MSTISWERVSPSCSKFFIFFTASSSKRPALTACLKQPAAFTMFSACRLRKSKNFTSLGMKLMAISRAP